MPEDPYQFDRQLDQLGQQRRQPDEGLHGLGSDQSICPSPTTTRLGPPLFPVELAQRFHWTISFSTNQAGLLGCHRGKEGRGREQFTLLVRARAAIGARPPVRHASCRPEGRRLTPSAELIEPQCVMAYPPNSSTIES